MRVSKSYSKTLAGYLRWIPDNCNLFRPTFELDQSGISAAEAMLIWESLGKPLPIVTSEPDLLSDYVQGKRSRDWHITEWREDIKGGLCHWREFIGTFGLTEDEVRKILPTTPWPRDLIEQAWKGYRSKVDRHDNPRGGSHS